jgi:hypothetical protein
LLGLRGLGNFPIVGPELTESVLPGKTPGEPGESLATLVSGDALAVERAGLVHGTSQ